MADPIRQALESLLNAEVHIHVAGPEYQQARDAARAALAAEPPAPAPAADGERDHVPGAGNMVPAAYAGKRNPQWLGGVAVPNSDGWIVTQLQSCAAAPAGMSVEELARLRARAADGEREELASALEVTGSYEIPSYEQLRRAAALLREARPQPVPVEDRPWKRPGWCDAEGRCWWFNRVGIPEWQLADGGPYGDFCLPHWAVPIPQPPQGGEVG